MSWKLQTIFKFHRHTSYRKCTFQIHWEYVGWKTRIPDWGWRVFPIFNRVRKLSALCVCVHTWQLKSFISGKMAGPCIHQHIHHLASIRNIFIEHVISRRGRYLTLLHLVEGELETLWEESRTIPTCLNCLVCIVTLRDLVVRAYRVPPPTISL